MRFLALPTAFLTNQWPDPAGLIVCIRECGTVYEVRRELGPQSCSEMLALPVMHSCTRLAFAWVV